MQPTFTALVSLAFRKKLLALTSGALIVMQWLVIVFQAIAEKLKYPELKLVAFFPSLILLPLLIALGITIGYVAHHEKKKSDVLWHKVGFELFRRLSYFSSVILTLFVGGWLLFSLVFLVNFLNSLKWVGPVFKVVLCIFPFILSVAMLALSLASMVFLFIAPTFFIRNEKSTVQEMVRYVQKAFENWKSVLKEFAIAFLPGLSMVLLCLAAEHFVVDHEDAAIYFLQKLILSIPTALLLAPFVNFFFLNGLKASKENKAQFIAS